MKFLILLMLMFSFQRVEAGGIEKVAVSKTRWLQRFASSNSVVQKALEGGSMLTLCLSLVLSSCSLPDYYNPNRNPEAAESQSLNSKPVEVAPPIELAPPEAFQPAERENPYRIDVHYLKGFGGISQSDIDDYMLAKDSLPASFYKDVLIHYRSGDNNFVGVAQLNSHADNTVRVIDLGTGKVRDTISTERIEGIYVFMHENYGDHFIKFSAMHLQELEGDSFGELGWATIYAKTRIIFSSDYQAVRVYGVQKSPGKIFKLSDAQRFRGFVHSDHIINLDGN